MLQKERATSVRVLIGNSAAKHAPNGVVEDLDGRRITTVNVPDHYTFAEKVNAITAADGVWNNHSQGDNVSDSTPDWVEADDDALATVLGSALNCPVGRPKNWVEEY